MRVLARPHKHSFHHVTVTSFHQPRREDQTAVKDQLRYMRIHTSSYVVRYPTRPTVPRTAHIPKTIRWLAIPGACALVHANQFSLRFVPTFSPHVSPICVKVYYSFLYFLFCFPVTSSVYLEKKQESNKNSFIQIGKVPSS